MEGATVETQTEIQVGTTDVGIGTRAMTEIQEEQNERWEGVIDPTNQAPETTAEKDGKTEQKIATEKTKTKRLLNLQARPRSRQRYISQIQKEARIMKAMRIQKTKWAPPETTRRGRTTKDLNRRKANTSHLHD